MKEILNSISHNIRQAVAEPDKVCTRTNRELVYGAVACAAVGIVLGLLLSPKKTTTIGSHNGNNNAGSPALNVSGDKEQEEE